MAAAVGDIYEVVYIQSLHGQQLNLVRHYKVASLTAAGLAATQPQWESRVAAAMTATINQMKTLLSTEWSLTAVKVQRIRPAPRTAGILDVSNAGAGSIAVSSLPTSCAAVLRYRTAFAGRKYRGRSFIGGIPVNNEVDSKIAPAFQVQLNALAFSLTQNRNVNDAGGAPWGVISGVLVHKPTLSTEDITSTDVDDVLRSQRRREVGKGV